MKVSADTVRAWRRSEALPAIDKVEALAALLHVDVADLVSLIARDAKSPGPTARIAS